jgi:HK97 family phage major capsid protein
MPDIDEIAANLYPIILGDFKYYMIVDRVVMTMRKLDEIYAEQGLVGFIARMRVGGDLILPEAFRVLKAAVS